MALVPSKSPPTQSRQDPARLLPWLRERNPLFGRLDDQAARHLFQLATLRKELRGRVLAKQDERASHLFVVIEGTVVMRVVHNKVVRELSSYEPGDVAGLLPLIDQLPSPYELTAVSNVEVIAIDTMKLAQLTAAFHPVAMALLTAFTPGLVAHLRDLDSRIAKLALRKNASVAGSSETFGRGDR